MRFLILVSALLVIAGCQREAPPRDYQNSPPAMTHPVTSSSQSPAAHGMKGAAPEPSSGVEGKNITRKPTSPMAATATLKDQAPTTTQSTTATPP